MQPLDPSFEIAKELKDRAEARAEMLKLQLDASQARVALLEQQLDNTSLRLQEAQTLLELTQLDRQYWHKRHDELAKEMSVLDAIMGALKEITRNSLR